MGGSSTLLANVDVLPLSEVASETFKSEHSVNSLNARLYQLFSNEVPYEKRHADDKDVAEFYQKRQFSAVWFSPETNPSALETALETLKNADQEGLDPNIYEPLLNIVQNVSARSDLEMILRAEIAMTRAVLQYIDDVGGERLSPKHISKKLFINPDPTDAVAILINGVQQDPSMSWIKDYSIERPEYQKLKSLLKHLRLQKKSEHGIIVADGKPLKIGVSDPRVYELRQALVQQGYQDASVSSQPNHFDAHLESVVKLYQKYHGMESDGIVGTKTLEAINTPIDHRIQQTIITMERWRWFPKSMPSRYVIVNIAGYDLRAYENHQPVLYMPVIVGQKMRQTPVFSSIIYSVRFNPSWGVPHMIAVQDKLKVIQNDPSYLRRKGFVVYDSDNQRVNPESVDWSSLSKGYFPYRLRQMPGSQNALGKIRFSITSPFDVYLHDTAEPRLFEKAVRNLSSGCIRVAKPVELGVFVFNDPKDWSHEKIHQSMQGQQTRNVELKHPVPVHMAYFTVWIDEQHQTHFVPDMYGQDQAIEAALKLQNARRFEKNLQLA